MRLQRCMRTLFAPDCGASAGGLQRGGSSSLRPLGGERPRPRGLLSATAVAGAGRLRGVQGAQRDGVTHACWP